MIQSLDDVKSEMASLFDDLRAERIKREDASELANIAGKYLKADSNQIARAMLELEMERRTAATLPHKGPTKRLSNHKQ